MPTHIELGAPHFGLTRDSVVLTEQIRTIDKVRLQQKVACLDAITMNRINQAMEISMGIAPERFLNWNDWWQKHPLFEKNWRSYAQLEAGLGQHDLVEVDEDD